MRLHVNLKLGHWGAWTFQQEVRTGMNVREIATIETPKQAMERFSSWNGTVR